LLSLFAGALRQAPKVILVGEMRDRELLKSLSKPPKPATSSCLRCTPSTPRKPSSVSSAQFPVSDQHSVRTRFGKAFRFIVSQRLLPKKDGKGRIAAIEILKSTLRTRDYVEKGEGEGKTLLDAMRDGDTDGMQHFDGELEKLLRAGTIDFDTGHGLFH